MAAKKKRADGEDFLDAIRKKFGKESIMAGNFIDKTVEVIPTGSINLDIALGTGGWPRGLVSEIYGAEASGKTSLLSHAIRNAQMIYPDEMVGLIDTEQGYNLDYADTGIGVDLSRLLLSQPSCAEEALDIYTELCKSGKCSLIAMDSVAALVPKAEIEGSIGDAHVALQARMMSRHLRQITQIARENNVAAIYTNQERVKIGGMSFGPQTTTTGGKAMLFYASVRVELRRLASLKVKEEIIGHILKCTVRKNRRAAPMKVGKFDLIYGVGIDQVGEILDWGEELGLIEKKGSGYYVIGDVKVQGRDAARAALEASPLHEQIYQEVMKSKLPHRLQDKPNAE